MVYMLNWLDRGFDFTPPAGLFPMVVERLRGTPARIEERIRTIPSDLLTRRVGESWSIQENVGHLLDLEELWASRLDELLMGKEVLREADLSNRATYEADHNQSQLSTLTRDFRKQRESFVGRLDTLDDSQVVLESLHPRLGQKMRTIDLCLFVAEHDDHHIARISKLMRTLV